MMDQVENGLFVDKPKVRQSAITDVTVAVGTPVTKLVGANAKRVRIAFLSDGSNFVQVSPARDGTAFPAIRLAPGNPQYTLDIEDWGTLIQGPWVGSSAVGAVNVTVIEATETY